MARVGDCDQRLCGGGILAISFPAALLSPNVVPMATMIRTAAGD